MVYTFSVLASTESLISINSGIDSLRSDMAGHLKNESFPHKGNEKYFTRLKREEEG